MKHFYIDEEYCVTQVIKETWNMYTKDGRVPTPEELLKVLAGEGKRSTTLHQDHPEFTLLRHQLAIEGYITIVDSCWNGDWVINPFYLNDQYFALGERFQSALPMRATLQIKKRNAQLDNDVEMLRAIMLVDIEPKKML